MKNTELDEIRGRLGALELLAAQNLTLCLIGSGNPALVAASLTEQFTDYEKRLTSGEQKFARLSHAGVVDSACESALAFNNQVAPAGKSWLRKKLGV